MPTRKDFVKIAAAIAANSNENARRELARAFCESFAKKNPRFDRSRFLRACNL